MTVLHDFDLVRVGTLVTVQWRGSPRMTVGVPPGLSEGDSYRAAADRIEAGAATRPGFAAAEVVSCVRLLRERAVHAMPAG
ncbi:MAG: hypothetical protein M3Y55_14495 [Pseudomonadota bacterium]|nr:hypothetical protein [Pseudomonadota bacterium]